MIITLTANPSLDRTATLDAPLARGQVQRVSGVTVEPGGKTARVRFVPAQGAPVERVVAVEASPAFRSRTLRWLLENMVRDEASELIEGLVPPRSVAPEQDPAADPGEATTEPDVGPAVGDDREIAQIAAQDLAHERHRLAPRPPAAEADRHAVAQLRDDLRFGSPLVRYGHGPSPRRVRRRRSARRPDAPSDRGAR